MLSGASRTLIIARPDTAGVLRKTVGADAGVVVVDISDSEVALRTLATSSPDLVVLDQGVLDTPHWRALISRVRQSTTDAAVDFRILSPLDLKPPDGEGARAMIEAASQPFPGGLSRRVHRYTMADGVVAVVNGATSAVVDLSVLGAQVLSHQVLKPRERVGMRLLAPGQDVVVRGSVAWSLLEQARGTRQLHYRAGLEFVGTDPDAIERYCTEHARQSTPADR